MREIHGESSRATITRENRAGETSRWVAEQQTQQQEGGRQRSNSAPPRLQTNSQGYQQAFRYTLQTNLGDHGRALAQHIEMQRSHSNPDSLDGTTAVALDDTTAVANAGDTSLADEDLFALGLVVTEAAGECTTQ